jgi:hypothetical protein
MIIHKPITLIGALTYKTTIIFAYPNTYCVESVGN